jgi:4-hydroxybenzoate polyprenyltransferase
MTKSKYLGETMIKELIVSMRPKQWYKNVVLFAGIIFSSNLFNHQMWITVLLSFIIFCMIAGSEYIINDIMDKERDIIHPKKCNRPIASGKLNVLHALIFAVLMLSAALLGAYLINTRFFMSSLAYFLIIICYTLFLKHIAIVDVITISIGFVLRAIAGCLAINVSVSPWLIICAFLLALFLALGKRKHELILLENGAINHRKVLDNFSPEILDKMMTIITSALIMSYSLYTFLTANIWMIVTMPVIIYGVFRCIFLFNSKNMGGEPEVLFKDKGMLACMILWVISIVGVLYIKP